MKTNIDYANNGNVIMDAGYHFKNKVNSNSLYFLIVACFALLVVLSGCKKEEDKTPRIIMTTAASNVSFFLTGSGEVIIDWGDGSEIETNTLTSSGILCSHSYSGSSERTINIKMTGNYNISKMYCDNNQLTSLDVSNNTALTDLRCNNNQLKKLNVNGCIALKYLYCEDNQLTSLDVSKNTVLLQLKCWNNQLTSLDVSKNTTLVWLACMNNKLTSLDVSGNKMLNQVSCNNNKLNAAALNALFETLYNNSEYKVIYIGDNPGTDDCDRSIATKKGWTVQD